MSTRTKTARALTATALAVTTALGGVLLARPSTAAPTRVCAVTYHVTSDWGVAYTADVRVTNLSGATWSTWDMAWDYPQGQRIVQLWNIAGTQTGSRVSLTAPGWRQRLASGEHHAFGLVATRGATNTAPATFLVNGAECVFDPEPTQTPPTQTPPTQTPPTQTPPTQNPPTQNPTPTPTSTPELPVVANPYANAAGYLDQGWSSRAAAAAAAATAAGDPLGPAMARVARESTAVWLESIASVGSLRGHLEAALAQQAAAGRPVVITLVLYNIPNRSCNRAPNGELTVGNGGLARYRTGYIDPIVAILAEPAFRRLRIAVVVEPDAMWGMLTGDGRYQTAECAEFARAGVYLDAIPYALAKLHEIPNVYAYLDITQSNLLGWTSNSAIALEVFRTAAQRTPAGFASVDGFAVNVADYDPVVEPFLDIDMVVGGTSIMQSRFVDWNNHIEEQTYIDGMRQALIERGFRTSVGMLVDTSRNGWGGPSRPTAPSRSLDLNTFVDASRVDRRPTRFTWCNQAGAGMGERPRANPMPNVHAYAWIKPPGESDGHYTGAPDFVGDLRCDPNSEMPPIGASSRPTNALPGAPPRGQWFPAAFTQLVHNAYPPV